MVAAADRAKRPAVTSVWLESRAPRGRRAEQPSGLDRERITAATVRLLDAEGLAKFSMRRLAAEMGVTAMSVYWYVDTKDDLLELALDSIYGEMPLPDPAEEDADWRDQLRGVAAAYRALLIAHPWISSLVGTYLNIGPHALAFAGTVHRIIGNTGLPLNWQTAGTSAVFQFVYGHGTVEGQFRRRCADAGMTLDDFYEEAMGATRAIPGGEKLLEEAEKIMEARGGDTVAERLDRDFGHALELMIAGIETMVARA
ncbi:TetR/AcrR family transcriptional regulator [Streptomyces sp. FIT100]|uniref:TetR/AcrR family transcriptional regulator n=1 Tax=Streptomyces sp. FIT100 TaxID=2837956 RepID=UPI0021C73D87|nr:TetR/AcrR family transcriptional regulator [Streptomyces sp. FIT100]UUN31256.1 TetR/AcrR family transcriptional regulator C-terminal domain-containing protein [Streptomyces sp. FIT100]